MLREIKCRYCDATFSVENFANFSVICPKCKRVIMIECEYRFGPVTPCRIYFGEKIFGVVESENINDYLRINNKIIRLNNTYLNAIYEALYMTIYIVRHRLFRYRIMQIHKKELNTFSSLLRFCSANKNIQIATKSGSLCLNGEWIGKPHDRPLEIMDTYYDGEILEIIFRRGNLLVYNPKSITSTAQELRIAQAKKMKWIYVPDGAIVGESVVTYTTEGGKLIKKSKYGTDYLTLKEGADAVYLGEWQWGE